MWTILKVFIEFVTVLLLCFGFLAPWQVRPYSAPWPEIKPAPPALEGKVLITGPPGKSLHYLNILLVLNLTCSNTKLTFAPCKSVSLQILLVNDTPSNQLPKWEAEDQPDLSCLSVLRSESVFWVYSIPGLFKLPPALSAKPPSPLTLMTAAASSFTFSNLFSRYAAITPLFCLKPPQFPISFRMKFHDCTMANKTVWFSGPSQSYGHSPFSIRSSHIRFLSLLWTHFLTMEQVNMYFCLQEHSSFSNSSIAAHFLHPRSHPLGCFPWSVRLSSHLLSTHPAFLSPRIHRACNYLFSVCPPPYIVCLTVSLSAERSTGYVVDAQQKRTAWLHHHPVSEISCNLTQS